MKKIKVVTGIIHSDLSLTPYFWIGNQGFSLQPIEHINDSKEEKQEDLESAQHHIKSLVTALKKLLGTDSEVEFLFNKSIKHYWGDESEIII